MKSSFDLIAFSNTDSTPLDVHVYEPWKYVITSYGSFLQNYDCEFIPLRLLLIILIDKDLEFPGFPMISIGILFIIQTRVVKMFSFKEKLRAIFSDIILSFLT